ncbi:MAG: phosphoglucosamine mutase [Planctomycetes bacterium]|nr:phosphoglucosamine mutase [Planctomycetota bacterium]
MAKRATSKTARAKKPVPGRGKPAAKKAAKKPTKAAPASTRANGKVIKRADRRAATARAKKASTRASKTEAGKINPLESLFGTDGIRARAGSGPLTPEHILAVGRALGRYLTEQAEGQARPRVLLGVDPRPSADMVGTALASGLIAECCDVHWPGMMSTPEVAFLTGHGPFAAGISVTASHNPAQDNGIKIFGADGRKLPEATEKRLELAVLSGKATGVAKGRGERFGWLELGRERHYEDYILKTFRKSFASLKKRPLAAVVDAAYGARSVDLQLFSALAHSLAFGKTTPEYRVGSSMKAGGEAAGNALDVYFMNAASPSNPDSHVLINKDCGSLHPEGCAGAVRQLNADVGICFDGDGDRCVLIDETGAIRDGDYMLLLLAADMKARGVLKNDTVVSTTMANLGLERALGALGIKLIRTDVGDKYVLEAMTRHGAVLGGEQSGHIIIADEGHLAGDGLYTALRIIEVMLDTGKPLSELSAPVTKFPQRITNLRTESKPALKTLKNLTKTQKEIESTIGDRGRVNVRYSGTEPLLRIMVEAQDDETLDSLSTKLASAARKDLGLK